MAVWPAVRVFNQLPAALGFRGDLHRIHDLAAKTEDRRFTWFSLLFVVLVALFSPAPTVLLAAEADKGIRSAGAFGTLPMWGCATVPPVAGFVGLTLFNQSCGS